MKKLMIAAFAAVLGLAANAAEFMWCAYNVAYDNAEYGSALTGTVYLFDGTAYTVDAIVANLTGSLDNALGSGALVSGRFNLSGTDLTANDSNQASMFVIVMNDADDGYWASDVCSVEIDDDIRDGMPAFFDFDYSDPITFSNIPEPTSGLLLVLGMAGLALRRKRA